jgi:hypothetical protein
MNVRSAERTSVIHRWVMIGAVMLACSATPAAAQPSSAPPPPATQDDDPDRDVNLSQPDFTLAALPTTLRVPRHRSAFRITHRFGRPLGQGSFGDLVGDLFGLDQGALIGLEYRFGVFRGLQAGVHRSSDKTIQFLGQYSGLRQDASPIGLDVLVAIEGGDNFSENFAPTIGILLSRELNDRGALYVEPMFVQNSNPLPDELAEDNSTFMVGLGARLRVRPTVYLMVEGTPRVSGHDPGVDQVSIGIEKRSGGHVFQLNFSNGLGTTLGQLARGGFKTRGSDDWHLGFNITRKFF